MPDDLKQRADAAWEWCEKQWGKAPMPADLIRAAVEASIAAALAPLVERVARLEAGHEVPWNVQPPPAEAKCAECGGIGFVCDPETDTGINFHRVPDSIHGCKIDGDGTVLAKCAANRRPCPACSKPEPIKAAPVDDWDAMAMNSCGGLGTPESRRATCMQHDAPYPCVQCGDLAAPAPSAQKAPERVWIRSGGSAREWALIFDTTIGPLQKDHAEYVRGDLLTAANAALTKVNARVEELEKRPEVKRVGDDIEIYSGDPPHAHLYSPTSMVTDARAEGRAAGIREAANLFVFGSAKRSHILALLDKTGEK
jgi:hypothetical protein